MAFPKLSHGVLLLAIVALFSTLGMCAADGHFLPLSPQAKLIPGAPSPTGPPASSTSDGVLIDQGIAFFLMLLALLFTYIIHSVDILDF